MTVTGSWYLSVIELSPWALRVFPSLWEKREVRGETGRCETPHAALSQQQSQTEDAKLHFQSISLMFLCENRTFFALFCSKSASFCNFRNYGKWTAQHEFMKIWPPLFTYQHSIVTIQPKVWFWWTLVWWCFILGWNVNLYLWNYLLDNRRHCKTNQPTN